MNAVAKGKRAVQEVLKTPAQIDYLVIEGERPHADAYAVIKQARAIGLKVKMMTPSAFRERYPQAQGMVAVLIEKPFLELHTLIKKMDDYPLIVAIDHLEDPYNFAAILRSCEAFGVKVILFPKDRQVQLGGTLHKVASGAIPFLDFVRVPNVSQALLSLRKAGYWIAGTDSKADTEVHQWRPAFPLVVVFGNENKGISKVVEKHLDVILRIPTLGHIQSLNVSVTAGIILHQVMPHLKAYQDKI